MDRVRKCAGSSACGLCYELFSYIQTPYQLKQTILIIICPIDGRPINQVEVDGTLLDVEASFCYLSGMLSAGGG